MAFLISALVLGLAANLHCVGMCGPLVLTLPLQQAPNKIKAALLYLLSKAGGYAMLGALSGALSYSFLLISLQRSFFLAMGCVLIVFAIWPAVKKVLPVPLFLKTEIQGNLVSLIQRPTDTRFLAGGFLNAFIPCGMVIAAMAAAAGTGSVAGAALYMFLFGIAAAPGLFVLMLFGSRVGPKTRLLLKRISAVIILLTGLFLIWRSFLPVEQGHKGHDILMQWCLPTK